MRGPHPPFGGLGRPSRRPRTKSGDLHPMSRITIGAQQTPTAADVVAAALDEVRVIVRIAPGLDPVAASAAGALVSMVSRIHHHVELDGDAALGPNPWG